MKIAGCSIMPEYQKVKHPTGFWQVCPMPTEEEQELYYEREYFQDNHGTYKKEYLAEEKKRFENRARIANFIWKKFNFVQPNGSLYDVGCGEGFFSNYFFNEGWSVNLCDISLSGLEYHNKHLINFFEQGEIYSILSRKIESKLSYDFINLDCVLEHVSKPVELLILLKSLMHKKSLLRIVVPNDFSDLQLELLDKIKIKNENWFTPPDHLNYFNFSSLKNLLLSIDFKIFELITDFSPEIYVANRFSDYWSDKKKGKEAHFARLMLENFLVKRDIGKYIDYMSASAKLDFGRTVIVYVYID